MTDESHNPPVRRRGRPFRRVVTVPVLLGGVAVALAACGSGSDSLGDQACVHVAKSISLYSQSLKADRSAATSLAARASVELREAQQPASLAASHDTDWQALAATLSESSRITEGTLVTALRDECASGPNGTRP